MAIETVIFILALGVTDEQIKPPGKAGYFAADVCLYMEKKAGIVCVRSAR